MEYLVEFFKFIGTTQGFVVMWVAIIVAAIVGLVVLFIRMFPEAIQNYLEQKSCERRLKHVDGVSKRKQFSKDVKALLRNLAHDVKADRALLFEYTNGTSNLIGLPFVYASAASEVVAAGVSPVSHLYQKINITIASDFLTDLEELGHFYSKDIEDVKSQYPVIYNFMKPNNAKSVLFYAIHGVEEIIGFIVVTTTGTNTFEEKDTMHKVAMTAQQISSLLNFEELDKKVHKNKKWLW
jgi:hypothetical protein